MDWSFLFALGLGALGAALLVGGVVGCLGSKKTGFRALSAGAAAAGLVILAVLGLSLPISRSVNSGTPGPTPVVGFTPVAAPTRYLPPTPTPEAPGSSCAQYLRLTLSWQGDVAEGVATTYQCDGLWVDYAGRAPSSEPAFSIPRGAPLEVRLEPPTQRRLERVEVRLYAGAGKHGAFLNWPEALPGGVGPVAVHTPDPSPAFQYVPPVGSGEYSLVVRAAWEGPVDVFYSGSFKVE